MASIRRISFGVAVTFFPLLLLMMVVIARGHP
jgi:hypothetical protein